MLYDSYADLNTTSGLIVAFFLFALGLIFVRMSHHQDTLPEQTRLFVLGYLARMTMIVVIYNFGLISVLGDDDSMGWRLSLGIYDRWLEAGHNALSLPQAFIGELAYQQEIQSAHFLNKVMYAALFLVSGLPGRITAASLNALAGALVPVLAFRMSMQIYGDFRAARYLGWTLALMPSLLVFSGLTAKEPLVVFFEMVALYCCVQIAQRRFRLRYFVALYFSTVAMLYLRFYIYYVILGLIVAAIFVPPFIRGSYRKALFTMAILVSPLVMYVGYRSAMAEIDESSSGIVNSSVGEVSTYGRRMGGASYVHNPFDITQPAQFVPGLLFGLVHLLYAPFPWNLARGSRLMLLTTPEVLWWYWAGTVRLVRGLRYGLRANLTDTLIPILFCLPLLYYYSLIFANIGLAYRYRAQIYPELILFAGLGYKRVKAVRGFESYRLPQDDDQPDEPAPPFEPQPPWVRHERFGARPNGRFPQWADRSDRFRGSS